MRIAGPGRLIALALFAIVIGAATVLADDADADLKRMQGDWMVQSMTSNGLKSPDEESQSLFRTVTGDKYTVSRYTKTIVRGTFKLNPAASPPTIDSMLEGKADAPPLLGIYAFAEGRLTICNSAPGKPRPTAFESKPGSGHTLTVWVPEQK